MEALAVAVAAIITAAGGFIASITLGAKQLEEARAARRTAEHTARQVSPNHGSSLADAIKRVENRQIEQARSIGGIRDDMRQLREEKQDDHKELHRRLSHLDRAINKD